MIAVDTNILVHSHRQDSPWHRPALACIRRLAEGDDPWLIPWPCLHEFFAVVTNPRVFPRPSTNDEACEQIDAWLASPSAGAVGESARHWAALRSLIRAGKIVGATVHDARIAAICLDHGVESLWTADRDFSRFPALRCSNPLVSA